VTHPKGGSDIACMETFEGPRAFSEPESRAVRDFVESRGDQMVVRHELACILFLVHFPLPPRSLRAFDFPRVAAPPAAPAAVPVSSAILPTSS